MKFILFIAILGSFSSFADTPKSESKLVAKPVFKSVLQKTLHKYASASSLQTVIIKTDENVALGKKSESKGLLKYQNKKIFIVFNGEKKTEFYFDKQQLILVEHPDADFVTENTKSPPVRKVTTLKKTLPPFLNSLLSLFSNPGVFNKEFTVVSEKTENNVTTVQLTPVEKMIKNINLKIDTKTYFVNEINFTDDATNKTSIQMSQTILNSKLNKADLIFTKQKNDEEITQ